MQHLHNEDPDLEPGHLCQLTVVFHHVSVPTTGLTVTAIGPGLWNVNYHFVDTVIHIVLQYYEDTEYLAFSKFGSLLMTRADQWALQNQKIPWLAKLEFLFISFCSITGRVFSPPSVTVNLKVRIFFTVESGRSLFHTRRQLFRNFPI